MPRFRESMPENYTGVRGWTDVIPHHPAVADRKRFYRGERDTNTPETKLLTPAHAPMHAA